MAILDQRSKPSFRSANSAIQRYNTYDQLFQKFIDTNVFDFEDNEVCDNVSDTVENADATVDSFSDSDQIVSSPRQWDDLIDNPMVQWPQDCSSSEQRDSYHCENPTAFGSHGQFADRRPWASSKTIEHPSFSPSAPNRQSLDYIAYHRKLKSVGSTDSAALHRLMGKKKIPRKSKSNPAMIGPSIYRSNNYGDQWIHHRDKRAEALNFRVAMSTSPRPRSRALKQSSNVLAEVPQAFGLGISCFEQADEYSSVCDYAGYENNLGSVTSETSSLQEKQMYGQLFFENLYIGSEIGQAKTEFRAPFPSYMTSSTSIYQSSPQQLIRDRKDVNFNVASTCIEPSETWSQMSSRGSDSTTQAKLVNVMKQHHDPMLTTSLRAEMYELYPNTLDLSHDHFPSPPELDVRHSFCNMHESIRLDALSSTNSITQISDKAASMSNSSLSSAKDHKRRSTSRGYSNNRPRKNNSQSRRALSSGFVNLTASDSEKLLSGVAPSGSSKTKARREKEAEDKRRRLSEAATRAIMDAGGDVAVLEANGLLGDYLDTTHKEFC